MNRMHYSRELCDGINERNAMTGDKATRVHAATAAALVGMSIARVAAKWRTQ